MDSHFSCLFFVAGSRSTEHTRTGYFCERTLELLMAVEKVSAFLLITSYLNLCRSLSFALKGFGVQYGRQTGPPVPP